MKNRIWEIDFIRGIAIILMIIFHLIVDLKDLYNYNLSYFTGFWYYIGLISAVLFILVSGVSSTFSKNNFNRGLIVFIFGMFVTVVTYFYNSVNYIKMGILHFLGISMILYHYLQACKYVVSSKYIFIVSTMIIILGIFLNNITINSPYLFPIGLINSDFNSIDYYPLIPWIGIFFYGTIIGNSFYKQKVSLLPLMFGYDPIIFLGRKSLIIYLIHQPILLIILFLYENCVLKFLNILFK